MSPSRTPILAIAVLALALTAAACGGGGGEAQKVVDEATLEGVESGHLDLSLAIDSKGDAGDLDIELSGPFETGKGSQPRELALDAAVEGTARGREVDFEGSLTLKGGNKAYVEFEGADYEVDATTYRYGKEIFEEPEEVSACREAVSDIPLSDYMVDPSEEGTVDVGGASTTKVSGDVDGETLSEALNLMTEDLLCNEQLKAVPSLQGPLAELEESGEGGADSLRDARIVLYIGDDHIVRRLQAQATVEPPKGGSGSGAGGAEGNDLQIDLTLTDVNQPQTISAPKSPKPLNALFLELGINPVELLGVVQGGLPGVMAFLERIASAGDGQ